MIGRTKVHPSTHLYSGVKGRTRKDNIKITSVVARKIGPKISIVLESLFSRKNDLRKDANFSGSPSQSCGESLLKGVLPFGNRNARVNQRCATLCEPMQGPSNSRFRVARDLAEKIVRRQEEPRLGILLTLFYSAVLRGHNQKYCDSLGQ